MPYVLLCTGSRDLADRAAVWAVLDAELAEHPDLWLRVGDCKSGADSYVRGWARRTWRARWMDRCGVYEAHWVLLGHRAGPERNGRMVRDGADKCAAWYAPPPAENKGTAGCVKLARKAGIPVEMYGWIAEEKDEQETLL